MCICLITVPLQRHVLILHKVIKAVCWVRFTVTAADCDNMFMSLQIYFKVVDLTYFVACHCSRNI